ncbi:MAG: hypothetical protein DBX55_00225 [Verrucomicrobia bacterium]|nr:MAG: hypothetical protein DBX55_00225 [Verrucomicrobiota bacterium]
MKVRVLFDAILEEFEDCVIFLISDKKVALGRGSFKRGKRNSIIVDLELAKKNRLRWKLLFHIPPYIEPEYNQACIDELRFGPEEGD